jgi:hypothetical protein
MSFDGAQPLHTAVVGHGTWTLESDRATQPPAIEAGWLIRNEHVGGGAALLRRAFERGRHAAVVPDGEALTLLVPGGGSTSVAAFDAGAALAWTGESRWLALAGRLDAHASEATTGLYLLRADDRGELREPLEAAALVEAAEAPTHVGLDVRADGALALAYLDGVRVRYHLLRGR